MKRKNGFQGSVTIEIALLMPFIVFLIWNILYLSFFTYNQCVILQGSYCTALRTERHYGTEEEKEMIAEEKYNMSVNEKVALGKISREIEIQDRVTVRSVLDMSAPVAGFFDGRWKGKHLQKAEKWTPVDFIRKCRLMESVGSNLGSLNKEGVIK